MHEFIPDLKLITSLSANRMQSFGSQLCGFIKQILAKACRLIHDEDRQEGIKMPTQKNDRQSSSSISNKNKFFKLKPYGFLFLRGVDMSQ